MTLKSNLLTMLATCLAVGAGGIFLTGCTKDSRNTADVIPGGYKLDRVQWSAPAATRAGEAVVDVSLVDVDSLNVHGSVQVYVTGDSSTDTGVIHIELPLDYFISRTFNLLSRWSPVPVPEYPIRYGKAWIVDVDYRVDYTGTLICEVDPALFEMFDKYLVDVSLDFDKENEELTLNLETNFGQGLNSAFFTKLVDSMKCEDVAKFLADVQALYVNPQSQALFNNLKANLGNEELEIYFESMADFLEDYFNRLGNDYDAFFRDFYQRFLTGNDSDKVSDAFESFGRYLEDIFESVGKQYEDEYEDFFEDFFGDLFNESYYRGTIRVVLAKQ